MKKIVIVTRTMIHGGIEKALISMLELLPKKEFDVTILLMEYRGELLKEIPEWVKVKPLYGETISIKKNILKNIKKLNFKKAILQIFYGVKCKRATSIFENYKYSSKVLGILEGEYDLAIADHVPASFPVMYVINNINAKRKVAWIHSDVSYYKNEIDLYKDYYNHYYKIFAVSLETANKFKSMYPDLSEKVEVFYNIISKEKLLSLASNKSGFIKKNNKFILLTVGRLCEDKGQDMIPKIASKLKKDGYKFEWYCIGDGKYRNIIQEKINKYNVNNEVILLGNKSNPYPYFRDCDIYVQPSRQECYCTTVTEAKCFAKPMIITDVNGSKEQIKNNVNGFIVKIDENEIYIKIKEMIDESKFIKRFTSQLNNMSVDTVKELKKLYKVLE
ncbi:MAG: Capsular polysaccharide biosynthsis protein [uncultured Clostridium sp.]